MAHVLLASHSAPAMVGAMLGDFVKADVSAWPPEMAREITLHRLIDSYTDRHPEVAAARARFAPGRRRFAGIALDVFYDHALSRQWDRHSDQDRAALIADFYRALDSHAALLPPRLAALAPRLIAHDWLSAYADWDGVRISLERMAQRLSRNGELLRDSVLDLETHYAEFSAGFERFFPELQQYVVTTRAAMV
nr:ACP phosphodiesterase [Massilia sp. TS11]